MNLEFGNCLENMESVEDDTIDLMATDPPYGLEFMGKDWDKALPPVEVWEETFRVLKPGAFAFIMCASRLNLMSRLGIQLEDVGFITEFTPIYWTYASGFPKAQNISKMLDRREGFYRPGDILPVTDKAKEFDGSYAGFQPKPAIEPIIVVMKPLSEKTYIDQALFNSKGITWLDRGRIPTQEDLGQRVFLEHHKNLTGFAGDREGDWDTKKEGSGKHADWEQNKEGRFPSHLIATDDILNDGESRKSGKLEKHHKYQANSYKETDTFKMRDRSGEVETYGDEGSFSRFFDLDTWFLKYLCNLPKNVQKTFPFLITPKPSKLEKNFGLENEEVRKPPVHDFRPTQVTNPEKWKVTPAEVPHGGANRSGKQQNAHPTVKPIQLMSWLIEIGSQKRDIILDPFLGSGTTAIASILTERKFVGYEINDEYFDISLKRVKAWTEKFEKETSEVKIKSKDVISGF